MSTARSLTLLALVLAWAAWPVSAATAQDDAADPATLKDEVTDEDAADATVSVEPVDHPMFRGRAERRALFVQGGGKNANTAVQLALEWLKHHQNESGYWDAEKFSRECKLNRCGGPGSSVSDVGVTGTVLLAYLGAGETSTEGPYRNIVESGLVYLRETQDAEGCFGDRTGPAWLHDHMWAAHAMAEAYGMTGSVAARDSARRAVHFILSAQNPYLGWGAGVRDGNNDTTMTALAMSVLHTADAAGLLELESGVESRGAIAWLLKMTEADSGRVGDVSRGGTGDPTTFPQLGDPARTAASLLARVQAGERPRADDTWTKGAALVRAARLRIPDAAGGEDDATAPDFTLWYWGARAMFESGRADWTPWRVPLTERLIALQHRGQGRDERGSWDTADDHASHGGRVFVTALNCLTLEIAYTRPRVFDRAR